MSNKKYIYSFATLFALAALATAVSALAQTTTAPVARPSAWGDGAGGGMHRPNGGMTIRPGVFGTVSAVNGNTITVAGKQGLGTSATAATTFTTVDATNAKMMKNGAAGTISSIVVGDTIMAQGTLTGTNLVATMIRDGQIGKGMTRGASGTQPGGQPNNTASPISGNGQPVIAGTVSAINGSALTITNKSKVTYTVDATNAKIVQGENVISASGIVVGDTVIVQGTVNGSSVIASSVIDQAKPAITATASGTATPQAHKGFFDSIGSFFSRIFGF